MTGVLRLEFGNLPLIEAAIRASFGQPIELRFSAINKIHQAIKEPFPHVTEPQQHEAAPGVTEEIAIRPGYITGVVFAGNPQGLRCTLQSRVAVVRWLKQFVGAPPHYPRFEALERALWDLTAAVAAAYELESLPVAVVNMSYVNFINVTDFSTVLSDYFSPLVHVKATEDVEEIRKVEVSWRETGMDLRFHLEKVSAVLDGDTLDGCRLTTVAGMHVPTPDADPETMLKNVHSRLQAFFRDVISERAKQEWQLEEAVNG